MIYGNSAQTEGEMSAKDLLNFLRNEQREPATMEDAFKLIEKYEVDATGRFKTQSALTRMCGSR